MSSYRVMRALRKIAGWSGPTPYEEGKTPEERRNLLDKEINHWGRYGTISHLPRYRKLLDERNRLRVADATKTARSQQSAPQPTAGSPRRGSIPFQPSIAAQPAQPPAAQPPQPRQIAAPVGQRAAAPQPAPNNEVQSFIDSFNPNSETFKSQYRDNWRFRDRFNKLRGENPDLYKGWQPPSGTYLY